MYKTYGYFLPLTIIIGSITCIVLFFDTSFLYMWQILVSLTLLFLVLILDIFSTILLIIYFIAKYI